MNTFPKPELDPEHQDAYNFLRKGVLRSLYQFGSEQMVVDAQPAILEGLPRKFGLSDRMSVERSMVTDDETCTDLAIKKIIVDKETGLFVMSESPVTGTETFVYNSDKRIWMEGVHSPSEVGPHLEAERARELGEMALRA